MKNWNGELPSDWHGAKCNSVISSSGNITCDNTSSTPIKCVCEKTGSGWDNGAHCAYDYDCKNNVHVGKLQVILYNNVVSMVILLIRMEKYV